MLRKKSLVVLLLASLILVPGCKDSSVKPNEKPEVKTESKVEEKENSASTKIVEDLSGNKVELPKDITKTAVLVGPGFEKIILLNSVDKATITGNKMASKGWAKLVAPEYSKVPIVENAQEPNIEQLLENEVQAAFFWDSYPEVTKNLEDAGIKVLVTQLGKQNINSVEEFVDVEKKEMKVFADVLGGEAPKISEEWSKYVDEKVKYVQERLKDINKEDYPKVYYVRGPEALSTHGGASYTNWIVKLAGGKLVTEGRSELLFTTTIEEVLNEDPEYIFMGRVDNRELILDDPVWANVKAVKEGNVFLDPAGVGPIDYSSEGFLLMLNIAKHLHPEKFEDLDMKQEVKDYFKKFYRYELTDEQAELYLEHKAPEQ